MTMLTNAPQTLPAIRDGHSRPWMSNELFWSIFMLGPLKPLKKREPRPVTARPSHKVFDEVLTGELRARSPRSAHFLTSAGGSQSCKLLCLSLKSMS
jgi:hypothetical protein